MEKEPLMQAVNADGEPVSLASMEEAGVGFDPTTMHLDLSKDEKRRTTALLMAISAYKELIIRDAEYLKVASDLARDNRGPQIKPARIDEMVDTAIKFDCFIATGRALEVRYVEVKQEEPDPEKIWPSKSRTTTTKRRRRDRP